MKIRLIPLTLLVLAGCRDMIQTEPQESATVRISMNASARGVSGLGVTLVKPDSIRFRAVVTGLDTVTWSSNDTTVASVSQDGVVASLGDGSTMIRASAGGSADSIRVFVEVPTAASIRIGAIPDRLVYGDSIAMVATALDSAGSALRPVSVTPFEWSSKDTTVIRVAGGKQSIAVAVGSGSTWIVASTSDDWNGHAEDSAHVTVVLPLRTGRACAPGSPTWMGLPVCEEVERTGYDRSAFGTSYRSLEDEIIAGLPKSGGQVYTPYTCTLFDIREDGTAATDIEHIVALAEAYDSGLGESQFRTFAGDSLNLTIAVTISEPEPEVRQRRR